MAFDFDLDFVIIKIFDKLKGFRIIYMTLIVQHAIKKFFE